MSLDNGDREEHVWALVTHWDTPLSNCACEQIGGTQLPGTRSSQAWQFTTGKPLRPFKVTVENEGTSD